MYLPLHVSMLSLILQKEVRESGNSRNYNTSIIVYFTHSTNLHVTFCSIP